MSGNAEAVKRWRQNTKRRMVESLGGKCQICGYNKCDEGLVFHHLIPSEKEFSLGSIRGSIKGWTTIITELRKCVLLCTNCHQELHAGKTELPQSYASFNEDFADYKSLK